MVRVKVRRHHGVKVGATQCKRKKPTGWLLPDGTSSGRRSRTWLLKATKKLAEAAEVPVVTPHGLRGTHGTLARASGAMGHLVA